MNKHSTQSNLLLSLLNPNNKYNFFEKFMWKVQADPTWKPIDPTRFITNLKWVIFALVLDQNLIDPTQKYNSVLSYLLINFIKILTNLNRSQSQFLQNSSHRIWKRLSPKELHHITPTSPRKQAFSVTSYCTYQFLFDQKLITSNNVHTNFNI